MFIGIIWNIYMFSSIAKYASNPYMLQNGCHFNSTRHHVLLAWLDKKDKTKVLCWQYDKLDK